jgi:endonuclease YncB( thermonuclease family)
MAVPPAGSPALTGAARVIDGDTLEVAGVRVRLEGIDAPEAGQTCETRSGRSWACGSAATSELTRLVAGVTVRCESRGADKYGRMLGVCTDGQIDVNAEMVRRGLAWAFVKYSTSYVAAEAEARSRGYGIWQGAAMPAWDYRAGHWQAAEPAAPNGCAIKGNIARGEKIYHMPWSPWYGKIRMDNAKGKRWFCTEAEAVEAGFRPIQTP